MSARQRQRIAQQMRELNLNPAGPKSRSLVEQEESEEESEEEEVVHSKKSAFAFDLSSDSSSEEEEEEEEKEEGDDDDDDDDDGQVASTPDTSISKSKSTSTRAQKEEKAEEDFLDQVIQEMKSNTSISAISKQQTCQKFNSDLFGISALRSGCLDLDGVIAKRFGKLATMGLGDNNNNYNDNGNLRNRHNRMGQQQPGAKLSFKSKSSIFGSKEDWPAPPSFVEGGLGMIFDKNRNIYCFEGSAQYKKDTDVYNQIKLSEDINRIVMFLIHINACHPDALVQLSQCFARYQQPDRALDMIRRALHSYEYAMMDGFVQAVTSGTITDSNGILLDYREPVNAPFFVLLAKYSQMVSMQGYHSMAVDLARFCLALHKDDPMSTLLYLDSYLMQSASNVDANSQGSSSRNLQLLKRYMGFDTLRVPEKQKGAQQCLMFTYCEQEELYVLPDKGSSNVTVHVGHLPTFWFSYALALFNTSVRGDGDGELAECVLAQAIIMYPFVVSILYENIEDLSTSLKSEIQTLLNSINDIHPYSTNVKQDIADDGDSHRLPVVTDTSHMLIQISHIYSMKNSVHWQVSSDRVQFLIRALNRANDILSQTDSEDIGQISSVVQLPVSYEVMNMHSGLLRYKNCYLEGSNDLFLNHLPQFPAEANPLDPQLANPIMLERNQIELQRAHMRRAGGGMDFLHQQLMVGHNADPEAVAEMEAIEQAFRDQQVNGAEILRGLQQNGGALFGNQDFEELELDEQQAAIRAAAGEFLRNLQNRRNDRNGEEGEEAIEGGEGVGDGEENIQDAAGGNIDNGDMVQDDTDAHQLLNRQDLQAGNFSTRPVSNNQQNGNREYRLDYEAPLTQLFVQSFFPWFRY